MCWEASNTEARMCTTSFITNTREDKSWNVLNRWTTCIQSTKTTKQTNKQTGHKFPGKVQEFSDSIMALNSLPIFFFFPTFFGHVADKEKKTRNVRQTVIQVLCAAFVRLPERRRLLGKLNDCTAASGAHKAPSKTPMIPLFFHSVSVNEPYVNIYQDKEMVTLCEDCLTILIVLSLIGNSVDVQERRFSTPRRTACWILVRGILTFPLYICTIMTEEIFQLIWTLNEQKEHAEPL